MVKCHFCYKFLLIVQFCECALQSLKPPQRNEIEECVSSLIEKIELVNVTDVTLININVSLVKSLHLLLAQPVRFISRKFFWPKDTVFNDIYVVQCVDFQDFQNGLDLVKRDPFWNPRAKFVIIIEDIDDFLEDMSSILTYNQVFDVAVVTEEEEGDAVVYSFGLEYDECDRPATKTLQLLSRCADVNEREKFKVTARKTKLSGCHVKFVSHNYWPFVSFANKTSIEVYILQLVQQFENITVELINYGQIEQFGYGLSNFTYTGMLHEIEIYNVEGAIGGYVLTYNRVLNMDFIYPYMNDFYKIVTARAKMLGKWDAVLKLLSVITVLIIFFTFCVFCIVVTLMDIFQKKERDIVCDILIVWGYFLNNIRHKKNTKNEIPYRLILLNMLLNVIVLSCAIQASLLSATTRPIRGYQPRSVDEVVSNYRLIMSQNLYSYLEHTTVNNIIHSKLICKVTLDCMTEVMKNNDNLYTIASNVYHNSYIWKFADENGDLMLHQIGESVGTRLQTMYVRRGSSLAEPFNRLLLRARSAGLLDLFFKRLQFKERLKYKFHSSNRKPQTLRGLRGVYALLMIGYVASFVCFVFEYWFMGRLR